MPDRDGDDRLLLGAAFPRARKGTLAELAAAGRRVRALANTVLLESTVEVEARSVYLVRDGFVAIDLTMPDDRRALMMVLAAGHLAGLMGLDGEQEPFRVVCLTSASLLAWPAPLFAALVEVDSGLSADLVDVAAGRLPYTMRLLGLFALASTRSRLATLLLTYEYLCFHPHRPVIGRGTLPALAAASREMTNRILRDWERSGVIRRHGIRGLELRDPRRLAEEAASSGFHPFAALSQARAVLAEPAGPRPIVPPHLERGQSAGRRAS